MQAYETGNRYHLLHSVALLCVPLTRKPRLVSNKRQTYLQHFTCRQTKMLTFPGKADFEVIADVCRGVIYLLCNVYVDDILINISMVNILLLLSLTISGGINHWFLIHYQL